MRLGWECKLAPWTGVVPRKVRLLAQATTIVARGNSKATAEATCKMTCFSKSAACRDVTYRRIRTAWIIQQVACLLQPYAHQLTAEGCQLFGKQVVQVPA